MDGCTAGVQPGTCSTRRAARSALTVQLQCAPPRLWSAVCITNSGSAFQGACAVCVTDVTSAHSQRYTEMCSSLTPSPHPFFSMPHASLQWCRLHAEHMPSMHCCLEMSLQMK